jgi:hypothetical protein
MKPLLIIDLFAGTGSSTRAFKEAGHTVITFELDGTFASDHQVNILDLDPQWILAKYGRPDFLWASPPCTAFSVASIGTHWHSGGVHPTPKTAMAVHNQHLVQKARDIAETLNPVYGFIIENPRGMLRKLPPVQGLEQRTVTYCQYGDTRMKPTDLWGTVPGWEPQPPCKNGDPCHEAAPRGSRTGTQGIETAKDRSRVPYGLGLEVLKAIETTIETRG